MTLQMSEPGLWIDPDIDGPATHAIVIGVSEYPHLNGGSGPTAANTFGLGQLVVSSITSFDVFDWLRDGYHHERAPIGSVALALAPTDAELASRPEMAGTFRLADYDGCELALNAWRQRLHDLPDATASRSRAAFFFSGHGLEISQQQQILLPSDYLDPARPSVNRAISTLNLKHGLLSFEVPDQLFFVDACRNGSRHLAGVPVEGNAIFDVLPPHANNPDARSALMYGTASGLQSWQPDAVDGGLSLFGTALLEAVTGGSEYDPDEVPPTIWFNEVADYANRSIRRQLRERGARVRQAIAGDLAFVDVVHATAARSDVARGGGGGLIGAGAADVAADLAADDGDDVVARDEDDVDADLVSDTTIGPGPTDATRGRPTVLFGGRTPSPPRRDGPAADDWVEVGGDADPHDWFGRESLTAVWVEQTKAVDLVSGDELGMEVTSVERADVNQHRVHVGLDTDRPAWLSIGAPNAGYGVMLPGGRDVTFEIGLDWDGDALEHVEVDLSVSSPYPVSETARLWIEARETSAVRAARSISRADMELATEIVLRKIASELAPLGAVVSSLVLLRAGGSPDRPAVPEPWARNMANLAQFRSLPDGIAIWTEVLSRLGPRAETAPAEALAHLLDRPFAPFTHDALAFAAANAEIAVATLDDGAESAALLGIRDWLSGLVRSSVPGGLFVVLRRPDAPPDRSSVLNRLGST